jgi:hypothetical protein
MKKISQKQKVLNRLLKTRSITTKQAENMGIGRLPVMVERLRKDGYAINTILAFGNKSAKYEILI